MTQKHILMVAAENDALPGAKVGGIGDVIRDTPPALAEQGCIVHVVIPSHGFLHKQPGAEQKAHFPVAFGGELLDATLFYLPPQATKSGTAVNDVHQWVVHHSAMDPNGDNAVYSDDGKNRPFATDATKYAFFCAAVGQAILQAAFGKLDVLHLHDWHAAFLAILRAYDTHYKKLLEVPCVYTIHNLALQGVRPFANDASSLEQWFPALHFDQSVICDPQVTHCVNPMRAAIELADKVHAVSPTYAKEIQRPSDAENLIYGGEGLECVLQTAAKQKRLLGILNGCEYPKASYARLSKSRLGDQIQNTLVQWVSKQAQLLSAHWLADLRLKQWLVKKERGVVLTSVGRITDQKIKLLQQSMTSGGRSMTVLDCLLQNLSDNGVLILLGSGDSTLERFLLEASGRYDNFLFLQGYSEPLAQALYASGDLFLMPSSFEPCGISQMLAMRAGQPCVVHGVGGLKDTVTHNKTGFVFGGASGKEQGERFIHAVESAITLAKTDPKAYKKIAKQASAVRFSWADVAQQYVKKLYA